MQPRGKDELAAVRALVVRCRAVEIGQAAITERTRLPAAVLPAAELLDTPQTLQLLAVGNTAFVITSDPESRACRRCYVRRCQGQRALHGPGGEGFHT
ncbi:hypothetical protein CHLRE_10g450254v5 [Chlamydomonas reinhardtii]|uniref:Uncharacterized protein n=1 Tax=Chlamydomonas reinhardtii TaxID=3055 RepID=A0A2K3DB53_CHLRE|nr:uncharacterized protein CHLRE_10g450254v5 [Chlamydomonas reinhardtii]PNW77753.1 hypothetical protein CHLRE_10g450254v5 [Chlamydomonas reinhardtii]